MHVGQLSASPHGRFSATKRNYSSNITNMLLILFQYHLRGGETREKELISTYDNCRTFARCITRGRVILISLNSSARKTLNLKQ